MLTRIVHNSPKLCTFFDTLNLDLSKPQRQHMLNLADALLVCEDEKTLAALQRQFIAGARCFQHGRFSADQPLAGRGGTERLAHLSGELGCGSSRTFGPAQSSLHQHRRLVRREGQGYPPSGTGGLVSRPQREYQKQTGLQERLLLSGSQPAHRKDRRHGRPAAVPASQNRAADQPSPQTRSTHSLSQQEQPGPQHFGSSTPSAAHRLGHLRAVRQLVRFRAVDQICPPPRLACDLRSQTQPQAQWQTHRSDRFRSQAQAVHCIYRSPLRTGTKPPTMCARPPVACRRFPSMSACSSRNGTPGSNPRRTL